MIIVLLALLIVFTLGEIYNNYKWQKKLERREKITRYAEQAIIKAVRLQDEQIKLTNSILNGQKLRHYEMNKQAKEIEDVLEEVKKIASDFNGVNKRDRRRR